MPKTALIAGSTGLIGKHLIKILADSLEYEAVIALVRKGSNFIHDGVFTVEVDYDKLSEYSEELKADDVFCCLGTTMKKAGSKDNFYKVDFTYSLSLAKIALINGSAQFNIITASGANADSMFYYNRVKGDIEKAISRLEIPNVNIFRPSFLIGARDEKRTGEQIGGAISKVLNPILIGRFRKYRSIKASVVAKAMFLVNQRHLKGIHIYESNRIQEIGQE
jgi:uncharacterized protein YbjT (DUF2867 family)